MLRCQTAMFQDLRPRTLSVPAGSVLGMVGMEVLMCEVGRCLLCGTGEPGM